MDHVGHPLPADRADGEVDVLQREAVRGHLFQGKALRRELRERELARLVAVPARALDGDELHRHALEREIRKLLELALYDDGAALSLQRLDAQENRNRAGAR